MKGEKERIKERSLDPAYQIAFPRRGGEGGGGGRGEKR